MDGRKLNVMKEYSNSEIKVRWEPKLCQHSGVCIKTLPKVYDLKKGLGLIWKMLIRMK